MGLDSAYSDLDLGFVLDSDSPRLSQPQQQQQQQQEQDTQQEQESTEHTPDRNLTGTEVLFRLFNRLKADAGLHVQLIAALVPIIKMKQMKAPFLELDLSHLKPEALTNALYFKRFLGLDPRVKPLLVALKFWSKSRGICDAFASTLNSFGWGLLMVGFLQTCDPPVLPAIAYSVDEDSSEGDGVGGGDMDEEDDVVITSEEKESIQLSGER